MKRYIPEKLFDSIKADFAFLVEEIVNSQFEYDFQLRNESFNLYHRGNSLGKIRYRKRKNQYTINVHTNFITDKMKRQFKAEVRTSNKYLRFNIPDKQLQCFYSRTNLERMSRKVKSNPKYKEELVFEQALITDNIYRKDLIIIDRQVQEPGITGRMDLLALVNNQQENYQFCVIEVKLGNNLELEGAVVDQVKRYVGQINNNFYEYKTSYESNFRQKWKLGLFRAPTPSSVTISKPVYGAIVVVGYSGKAKKNIDALNTKLKSRDDINLIHLSNRLDKNKLMKII